MSRDAWLTLGALLIASGVALLLGLAWYPGKNGRRGR